MKICVIGGGAAGMMAALTAAESGHSVLLLERQSRVGRKLLATGNGRCNLTNYNVSPAHYHGGAGFCDFALEQFDVGATLQYFASLGLLTVSESSGRVYPMSNMAGSVLDVLRYALERSGIDVRTNQVVTGIRKAPEGFAVHTETAAFSAQRIILAAGGGAGSKVGGVMDGYRLAKDLGHHRTALYPSLDLSRTVSTGGEGLSCVLNFFPDWSESEVLHWLGQRREAMAAHEASTLLTGSCHTRLGQMICKAAGFTNQSASTLTRTDLRRIAEQATHFTLLITGTCGFDQAQVTAGGLDTREFDPQTLQSRLVPGLYACGEVLDVDGDCGGYNLQWAWSSGRLAGKVL